MATFIIMNDISQSRVDRALAGIPCKGKAKPGRTIEVPEIVPSQVSLNSLRTVGRFVGKPPTASSART